MEKKHHTRATIAALKHEKSLFIFDRLPTFNGRVYVLHKQTVELGLHKQPTAVALVVSWITGYDGAVVKMAHTELYFDSATVNRASLPLSNSSVVTATFPDVRVVASALACPHCKVLLGVKYFLHLQLIINSSEFISSDTLETTGNYV